MNKYVRTRNPFPGLRPFESTESHVFFGRDGQLNDMLTKLHDNRFVAVVGTSSSGKSSLVRASLIPELHGGIFAGVSKWRVAVLRPGGSPLQSLGNALDEQFGTTGAEITVASSSLGLVQFVKDASLQARERLLIVVDQFEELFRYISVRADAEEEAAAFVQRLLVAVSNQTVPIYIVLTLRSDFLGDCARFWGLLEELNKSIYLVPRMFRDQVREAITRPIAVFSARINETLVNRLLNEVGDNPDHLPVLQHALQRTWDYWSTHSRDNEPIGMEHYEAIGTLKEALGQHAEEALSELDSNDQRTAEILLRALTGLDSANREYRRPTSVQELCEIADTTPTRVAKIIDLFRREDRAFLMPPIDISLTPDTVIDISHESLMRNWPRLNHLVREEAESAQMYMRLAETAILKERGKEDFLGGPALQLALRWRDETAPNEVWALRYHPDFENAMRFLQESKADAERRRHRSLRWTRVVFASLIAMALVSIMMTIYAWRAGMRSEMRRQEAETQRRHAEELTRQMEQQKILAEKNMHEAVERARRETQNAQAAREAAARSRKP